MSSAKNNSSNIANTEIMTTSNQHEERPFDVELGKNNSRVHLADTESLDSNEKDLTKSKCHSHTIPYSKLTISLTDPKRTTILSKLRARLTPNITHLPLLAHAIHFAFALPGFVFVASNFHHKAERKQADASSRASDAGDVNLSHLFWILFSLLWSVTLIIECINGSFKKMPSHGPATNAVRELVRILLIPLCLGLCLAVVAGAVRALHGEAVEAGTGQARGYCGRGQ